MFGKQRKDIKKKNKNSKTKDKKGKKLTKSWIIWLVVVIAFFVFPVIVDRLLTHKCYEILFQVGWLKKPSLMEEGDWFSFIGSYMGAIGTIIIGMIAYQQSQRMGNLQEQVNRLQTEMTEFQMHPIISIKKTRIEVRSEPKEPFTIQSEMADYYFSIYGEHWEGTGIRYIKLELSFEDKGIVPTIQCEIQRLTWEVAEHKYDIQLDDKKRKLDTCDKVRIIIDDSDVISDKDQISEKVLFFENICLHRDYRHNKSAGFNRSILRLEVCFINQKEKSSTYEFSYCIRSDDELKIGSPFIRRI